MLLDDRKGLDLRLAPKVSYWARVLTEAPKKGTDEHERARWLSFSWGSCAVGEAFGFSNRNDADAVIERLNKHPEHQLLTDLGTTFHQHVVDGRWDCARKTYNTIQEVFNGTQTP